MKTSHLLSTVAATLLLGTGVTMAQSTQTPERAPSAQQQAPAEKMGPSMNAGEKKAPETTGQASPDSKSKASPDSKSGASSSPSMKTDEKAGDSKSSATSGQAPSDSKASSDTKAKPDSKAMGATDANKATSGQGDSKQGASTQSEPSNRSAAPSANQSAAPGANPSASSGTTGQGAAGAAKLSTEQQTRITTVIKKQDVKAVPASKLNVSISVGTRVPTSVHLYPLPSEVITVYPEWRGYYYILVGDQIVIIQPTSHEIVYIIAV